MSSFIWNTRDSHPSSYSNLSEDYVDSEYEVVLEPKKCCCCCSVRAGTIVLAALGLIAPTACLFALLSFVTFSRQDFVDICYNVTDRSHLQVDEQLCANGAISFIIVTAVVSGLVIVIKSLLIVGVVKTKPQLMMPYFVAQGMTVVLLILFGLMSIGVAAVYGVVLVTFGNLIFFSVIICLEVYFILVARVCYKEVKQLEFLQHPENLFGF